MKKPIEIELTFVRKDFEEVYFNGNQANYFKSQTVKKPFQNILISGLIFSLLLYNTITENSGHILTIVLGIFFVYNTTLFLIKAYEIFKRRSKVKKYLDDVEKIKSHKLILTDTSFEIIQEHEKTIEKWTDFKSSESNDLFIYLLSEKENYLIPSKSMTEQEYIELTNIVTEKIKAEI
ncbi:hypothetical protein PG913_08615 [Tenacibaculum pacificus]|uniref:hypothetical protein n=1 Tax=Tenacibaculum pacificus TaxID=3018314 RepID=UPI0022F3E642|nr:hypothetical protein [Tenacibaculum pacificus]WBX72960.1 hypothetical protein PG913_08615 [Tenacibaculum pacificus]